MSVTATNPIIEDAVKVASKMYPDVSVDFLRDVINKHWEYGTMDVVYRKDELISMVRWNISPNGMFCDVLDWYVKDGENGFRLLKHLIARNWKRFPGLKYLRFARQFKYPGRKERVLSFKKIFHIKEN
jgi:hypothetical protein